MPVTEGDLQRVAESLGGAKKTPEGYVCRCPAHDDKQASLSVKIHGSGNGYVFNCFAGCSWESIKSILLERGIVKQSKGGSSSDSGSGNKRHLNATSTPPLTYYYYYDIVGNPLCRKVKLPNKKMWVERFVGKGRGKGGGDYESGLDGMVVPLYNLRAVLESEIVYLCEGEKDAETLIKRGLCATTNHAGATSWHPTLTEQLTNRGNPKTVIIIPDNDPAGRKRVAILTKALQGSVKEVRCFVPDGVPEHGDITDWVENGGDVNQIYSKSTVVSKTIKKKASREEYFSLFERVLNSPRRCIFLQKLMTYDEAQELWNPALNCLDVIKSEALVENERRDGSGDPLFVLSNIQPHFFAFEASKALEFLVDVPEWDGKDRIGAMASLIHVTEQSGISPKSVEELLKEWCSLMFERLEDSDVQNRILVLQGGQGIGKDTWTTMLLGGLGQYCVPLSVVKEDKDTFLSLHSGLVMRISEFDKTAKTEVSTLKDIITNPSTNLRAPYDKDAKLRLSRCSFISSANIRDIFRDSTGNRRFLVFEVKFIEYAYSGWSREQVRQWQSQCLAQAKTLSESKYRASTEAQRQMAEYVGDRTPDDWAEDLTGQFVAEYERLRAASVTYSERNNLELTDGLVKEALLAVAKVNGAKLGTVKGCVVSIVGKRRRIGSKRFWTLDLTGYPEANNLVAGKNGAGGSGVQGIGLDAGDRNREDQEEDELPF